MIFLQPCNRMRSTKIKFSVLDTAITDFSIKYMICPIIGDKKNVIFSFHSVTLSVLYAYVNTDHISHLYVSIFFEYRQSVSNEYHVLDSV